MASVSDIFAGRLRRIRGESGLSQRKFGNLLSLSPATIGYYENGDRIPSIDTAVKIAKFFDVSTDYLLGLTDSKGFEQDTKDIEILSANTAKNLKLAADGISRICKYMEDYGLTTRKEEQ